MMCGSIRSPKRGAAMTEVQVLTVVIVVLAVPFLAEAMRRGLGRALAAMAVMGTWLGVTLSGIRRVTDEWAAGEAARDYAIVMTIVLFLYFGGQHWLARKSDPTHTEGSETPGPAHPSAARHALESIDPQRPRAR